MELIILKEVDTFILTLEKPTRSKWLRQLMLLVQYGQQLGMPHVKQISKDLRELRVRGVQEIRAFFVFQDNRALIVHAFIKKTQKTPQKEIATAQKRILHLLTNT
ncbi:TPA: hypothetical protein DIV55_06085 [Patescibacteria group bacterium]|uniref:Phage-related protein n=1 Tax=Candidatus Gottesmanbacteria bacterium GW2011_GWA1_43_11 TaxID=1618436 RepID=A0A0G1CD72_9BACT|nr:MAG: hypothetical protein UV59_C0037G0011 [Candidatus Gottesmanbacteria bacterium GW2011_GWA1_43_11]HCS79275.1 hypothetical protein [Patescibacteria group bacterium]